MIFLKTNWLIISSIAANTLVFIKWVYNTYKTKKIGKANLAGRRYKELYIPLNNILHEVKIESFVAYKGDKKILFKKLSKEIILYILLKSDKNKVKKRWNEFNNPILNGPTYDFPWEEPDINKMDELLKKNRFIVPKGLEEKWIQVIAIKNERNEYSEEELNKAIAELVIYIRNITRETQKYMEKNYPSLLVE